MLWSPNTTSSTDDEAALDNTEGYYINVFVVMKRP